MNLKLIDFQLEIVLLRTTILFKVINVFTGMFCLFSVTDESRIFFSLFCTCPKQASLYLRSVAQKRDEKYFLVYDDEELNNELSRPRSEVCRKLEFGTVF